MYRPALVTPPTIKPITLTEAKAQLDVGYTDKDTLIGMLIAAATSHLDGWTGILVRCLCEQTWRQDYDGFAYCLRLPLFPVISITSVKYLDAAGAEQTVQASDYSLQNDDLGAFVRMKNSFSEPSVQGDGPAVSVNYLAGYADVAGTPKTSSVPDDLKHAMLLHIRHLFDNPGAIIVGVNAQSVPLGYDALVEKYRRQRF